MSYKTFQQALRAAGAIALGASLYWGLFKLGVPTWIVIGLGLILSPPLIGISTIEEPE